MAVILQVADNEVFKALDDKFISKGQTIEYIAFSKCSGYLFFELSLDKSTPIYIATAIETLPFWSKRKTEPSRIIIVTKNTDIDFL